MTVCMAGREADKECALLEKKLQRRAAARAAEIASLSEQLQGLRDASAQQLSSKDAKVTDLIEELGNTQALLSEKEAALAEARSPAALWPPILSRAWSPLPPGCSRV